MFITKKRKRVLQNISFFILPSPALLIINLIGRSISNIWSKKLNYSTHALYSLICKNSALILEDKIIYEALISPMMGYASVAWAYSSTSNIDIPEFMQDNLLRMFTGAPLYIRLCQLHGECKLKPFLEVY
jgi:membrane-anchored glycerophosphoryl diester phosphodiesterase (GDPDase)